MQQERITTRSGVELLVEKRIDGDSVRISIEKEPEIDCLFHWGVRRPSDDSWRMPPRAVWPEGSRDYQGKAVQTPFAVKDGETSIQLVFERPPQHTSIEFVLFFPDASRWDNNGGGNYRIRIPDREKPESSPLQLLESEVEPEEVAHKRSYRLTTGDRLAVVVTEEQDLRRVALVADTAAPPVLHWGVARRHRKEWIAPPRPIHPPDTAAFGDKAAETPFSTQGGFHRLQIEVPREDGPIGISFVLRLTDPERWIKDDGEDFYIPLALPPDRGDEAGPDGVAREIIEKEMSRNSWTLMHRFNLCYDLLDRIEPGDAEGLALLFVWLRFSALRQLDWQRNYNTKPRELGHSQDRLTLKLAERYKREGRDREWIRLIMSTLGRGGDAQRVRDEVLNIMHRHHIKEVSGHFMEEWHQKLHNNTTPDDIVLCEAFLAFLRSDGNLDVFYRTLNAGGVTKERLESYERPIKSEPDFIPHLKDPLIRDFENFLRILKEVHSGTDLATAAGASRGLLDGDTNGLLDFILSRRNDQGTPARELAGKAAEARRRIKERIDGEGEGVRELIYLDLSLEDSLRDAIERNLETLDEEEALGCVSPVVRNLLLWSGDEELGLCLRHWEKLQDSDLKKRERSLMAQAVLDRLQRIMGESIDRYYGILQPKAEFLGRAFKAESWTIRLFGEEVIRGTPAFALSALIRRLMPMLRRSAELGSWQVISRGRAQGELRPVLTLRSIQEETFHRPMIIVADKVGGDEEIPEGVTAVLTPDSTDIVSHLAIRARNARILFATCYDPEEVERLKSMKGRSVKAEVNPGGDVVISDARSEEEASASKKRPVEARPLRPRFTDYVMRRADFSEEKFGGKSNNLNRLQGRLPDWIRLPASAGVPFGIFERILAMEENRKTAERYDRLTAEIDAVDRKGIAGPLEEIRRTVLQLEAPDEMFSSLRSVMQEEGLWRPQRRDDMWTCIKRVWASKWNERAFLSRLANGIDHRDLYMAVLIQQVVEADYSFVIHTVNPFTGDRDSIYAEVVSGLGETLVGNHPGKALSFTAARGGSGIRLLSFPGKSAGLFGGGLIFRSDSNGEDLAEYAGAGLYDSYMLDPPQRRLLDYSSEKLIWNKDFREQTASSIADIGKIVEEVMGSPQDIEGACSKDHYYVVQTRPQVGLDDGRP